VNAGSILAFGRSLAKFHQQIGLRCRQLWAGRTVHSHPRSAANWNLPSIAARCADRRGSCASGCTKKQAPRRHGREVRRHGTGRSGAICRLAESSVYLTKSYELISRIDSSREETYDQSRTAQSRSDSQTVCDRRVDRMGVKYRKNKCGVTCQEMGRGKRGQDRISCRHRVRSHAVSW
jgi:hypothetical protein